MRAFTITLTEADAQVLLAALGDQPLKIVLSTYLNMRQQIEAALHPSTPTTEKAEKPSDEDVVKALAEKAKEKKSNA